MGIGHQRKKSEACQVCGALPGVYCWNLGTRKKGIEKHTATLHYWREGGYGDPSTPVWDEKKEAREDKLAVNRQRRRAATQKANERSWVVIAIQMGGDIGQIQAIADKNQDEALMDIAGRLLSGVHALVREVQ